MKEMSEFVFFLLFVLYALPISIFCTFLDLVEVAKEILQDTKYDYKYKER